ncbi:hypothetical protein AYI68_g8393 [Smittium mucronatum]|uniref:Uncharacterized protein n=1 Tax=Smittium mucronatum TaxID=133383 RepID=A0A1R0GL07_9FUNG|nr:hypothetical protein AYI68_g8393 [Smittium mucronatum]
MYSSLGQHIHNLLMTPEIKKKKSVFNAPTVEITGESLIGRLGPELNESPNKEYTKYFITDSLVKLTGESKPSPSSGDLVEIDVEISLSLPSTTPPQAINS